MNSPSPLRWFVENKIRGLLYFSIIILVTVALVYIKVPTRVRLNLTVNKISFLMTPGQMKTLIENVQVKSISVRDFSAAYFKPNYFVQIQVPGKVKGIAKYNGRSQDSSHYISESSSITIESIDGLDESVIQIQTLDPKKTPAIGTLNAVTGSANARITLQTYDKSKEFLSVKINNQPTVLKLTPLTTMRLAAEHCRLRIGDKRLPLTRSRTFKTMTANRDKDVTIKGEPRALSLSLNVPFDQQSSMLSKGFDIQEVSFENQSATGANESAIVESSYIYYPYFSDGKRQVSLNPSDHLFLSRFDRFRLDGISWNNGKANISVRLEGYATPLIGKTAGDLIDCRLSLYDIICAIVNSNPYLVALCSGLGILYGVVVKYLEVKGDDNSDNNEGNE